MKGYRSAWHKGGFKYLRKEDAPPSRKEVKTTIKKALRQDKEMNSYNLGVSQEITSTAAFTSLSQYIVQGDALDERIGDELKYTSIKIDGFIEPKSTGAGDRTRLIVFQWLADNAVDAPTVGSILEDTATNPINSDYVMVKADRAKFHVLYDKSFGIPAIANLNSPANRVRVRISGKRMRKVKYNLGATNGSGMVYLMLLGTKTTGTTASNLYGSYRQNWTE